MMEFITKESINDLKNSGVTSKQLLCPNNSGSHNVTITEVHLQPDALQPRHTHECAEQIWYALKGSGKLLLADDNEQTFKAGDVVRFEPNDVHGLLSGRESNTIWFKIANFRLCCVKNFTHTSVCAKFYALPRQKFAYFKLPGTQNAKE